MLRDDSSILDGQHLDLQAVFGGVLPDEPAQLVPHFLLVFDDSNFQHPAVSPFSVPFHLLLFIETYFGAKCNGEVRNRFLPICKDPPECCFRLSASIKLQRLEQLVRTLLCRFIITFRKHIPAEVRVQKQQNRPGFRNRKPGRLVMLL